MVNNLQYQLVTKRILPQRTGGMGGEIAKLRGLMHATRPSMPKKRGDRPECRMQSARSATTQIYSMNKRASAAHRTNRVAQQIFRCALYLPPANAT